VGSFLAGLIPVTRINLFPVLPIVIMYVFWEHGFKKGTYGLLVSLVPFVGMHIIYWPGIMRMWTQWSNEALTYFLDIDQLNPFSGESPDVKEVTTLTRLLATFQVIRMQFPAIFGAFTVVSLWPEKWTDQSHKKTSIFLLVLFSVLLLLHFWVSVMLDITVFAFFRYVAYFYILSILLIISTWKNWNYTQSIWKRILIGIVSVVSLLGISVSNSEVSTYFGRFVITLLQKRALSFENGKIVLAPWKWWETFQGQLGWEFSTSLKITGILLFFFSTLVILIGLMILYSRYIRSEENRKTRQILPQLMIIFLVVGTVLSPTEFYGGGWNFYDCRDGVFDSYQEAANEISKYVEKGDLVFWIGVDTQSVLLELSELRSFQIYPQQLNAMNTFRLGGDTDTLTRIGLWNDEVAQAWVDGSQVLLFEDQALTRWFGDVYEGIDLDNFKMVSETGDIGCTTNQRITIYRQK
jgi:hypothetical protein